MADLKITALDPMTTPVAADVLPIVDDPAGSPETQKITFADLQAAVLSKHRHIATVIVAADGSGDYTDIQDGIDALPAGGGFVFIKDGEYEISVPISIIRSNISLVGQGEATVIKVGDAANCDAFVLGDAADPYSDINLWNFKINGNGANQVGAYEAIYIKAKVSKVSIRGIHFYDNRYYSILHDGTANYLEISNCFFDGDTHYIMITDVDYINIESNVIDITYERGMLLSTCNNVRISNNYIRATGGSMQATYGIGLSTCTNAVITGNIINGIGGNGILIYTSDRVTVVGNIIRDLSATGINVYDTDYCVITGNYIEDCYEGIYMYKSNFNTVSSNDIFGSSDSGMYLSDFTKSTVIGNNIKDSSTNTNDSLDGIRLDYTSTRNIISGNNISNANANKPKYGINEEHTDCDYNLIQGNQIEGYVTSACRIRGANTLVDTNLI